MSRLAFAAGRGARIQFRTSTNRWIHSHSLPLFQNNRFRIHPDDAHMQYGPISSELRHAAEAPHAFLTMTVRTPSGAGGACEYTSREERTTKWACAGIVDGEVGDAQLHRSLFLLFAAEALADKGC